MIGIGAVSTFTPWIALSEPVTALSVVAFALAVALLAVFDISLPRGDAVGVSAALDVVTLVLFGPWVAITVAALGLIVARSVRIQPAPSMAVGWALSARSVGLAAAYAAGTLVSSAGLTEPTMSWLAVGAAAVMYFTVEAVAGQAITSLRTGRSLLGLLRGNLKRHSPVALAELSAALLAIMVYKPMAEWSLLLVIALLMLIRQSYALLLGIAESYRTTVEVLVSAAEGVDTERSGHGERVAHTARSIAAGCRLGSAEIERISYAALLHDVGSLSGDEGGARVPASAVVEGARFFEGPAVVLRVCDGRIDGSRKPAEADQMAAMIVALASDIDAAANPLAHVLGRESMVAEIAHSIDKEVKARVVAAALRQGFRVPAVP